MKVEDTDHPHFAADRIVGARSAVDATVALRFDKKTWVLTACFLVNLTLWQWASYGAIRHRYPGQWVGDAGFFGPIGVFPIALLAITLCTILCLEWRRWLFAALMLGIVATPWIEGKPSWEKRVKVELPMYQRAVETGQKFGDQFDGKVGERPVVVWRWITFGIDNGEGFVYDPLDRLEDVVPINLYYGGRHDTVWKVTRIKRGYYFVIFS